MSTKRSEGPSTLSIVVGTDFNDASGLAFDAAARLAQRVSRSELHLVHVFETEASEASSRELIDHLRLYANEKAAIMGGLRGMTVGIHLRSGKPVREIAQLATDVGADLIVVGSRAAPHVKSWLLGSTAEQLLAAGPIPVLIVGPRPTAPATLEPAIEPVCSDCVRVRAMTSGASWWCERHSQHAKRAHTYSYQRELPFESHDSEVIPTGIDASRI
jgi:nucleotide-binding universal stress UspA family protein